MIHIKGKKILLVADAYKRLGSPSLVIEQLIYLLRNAGAIIGVYATDIENTIDSNHQEITEYARPTDQIGSLKHLVKMRDATVFSSVINKFQPDIVHFVPISYSNSGFLVDIAKSAGIHTVGQLWGPGFYCASNYAILGDQICSKCANGLFHHAIKNHCVPIKSQPIKLLSLSSLRRSIRSMDILLSTSKYMDDRLKDYGIEPNKIIRIPLTFPANRVDSLNASESKHIIFYGQPIRAKGVQFLYEIVRKLPDQKFEFYFLNTLTKQAKDMNLQKLINLSAVTIKYDKSWENGVAERMSSALVVLIPTIWPTTTEMVLMESLGLGKAIVAFNVGIHAEILKNNENALVYNPNDIDGFTNGVKKLVGQPELRKKISAGAKKLFCDLTDSKNILNILDKVYDYK